jgi:hypothetical protein
LLGGFLSFPFMPSRPTVFRRRHTAKRQIRQGTLRQPLSKRNVRVAYPPRPARDSIPEETVENPRKFPPMPCKMETPRFSRPCNTTRARYARPGATSTSGSEQRRWFGSSISRSWSRRR